MSLKGLDGLVANLKKIASATPQRVARALSEEAEIEMTEAKRRCPVDTGALRGTGHVAAPVISRGHVSVSMGFGGPAAPYAVPVHENLEAHHPHGQAKFLESVVREAAPHLGNRIAVSLRIGQE